MFNYFGEDRLQYYECINDHTTKNLLSECSFLNLNIYKIKYIFFKPLKIKLLNKLEYFDIETTFIHFCMSSIH